MVAETKKAKLTPAEIGAQIYEDLKTEFLSDADNRRIYAEESAKGDLWQQLVEARLDAGITQAQMAEQLGVAESDVARMEDEWFENSTLTTIIRYVAALGEGYSLEMQLKRPEKDADSQHNAQSAV